MFPRVSDIFNYVFGTDFCFPAQSFGFFVALAFIAAFQTLRHDMRLREKAGQFPLVNVKVISGGPILLNEVFIQMAIWALIGYKIGYGILDWDLFCEAPQNILLSPKGSIPFAIGAALVAGGIKFFQYLKHKDREESFEYMMLGPSRLLGTIVTIAFVAGLLGAKVFHNLEYFEDFMRDPLGALVSFDGLTFYGGLLTAGGIITYYLHKKGYKILHMMDVFAPCLILAYGIGRIGCMTAGDGDWGINNPDPMPAWLSFLPEWMWSFDFPHNVNEVGIPIDGCFGKYCSKLAVPVYPTPFYETLMCFSIFGVLWFLRNRVKFAGQLTGIYFFLNGLERFSIEKIRVNSTYNLGGIEITQAEIISGGMILIGIIIFSYVTFIKKGPKLTEAYPKEESNKTEESGENE